METARSIEKCQQCYNVCLETIGYCLDKGEHYADRYLISALQDCARLCQTTVDFLASKSKHYSRISSICADICIKTAEICNQFYDKQLDRCAVASRQCASACRVTGDYRTALLNRNKVDKLMST